MNRQELETILNLELPNNFENYQLDIQESIIDYLKYLNPIERKAYIIAKEHLGSSFNLTKSNGYIEWKKTQK